jgi:hypothetical protein
MGEDFNDLVAEQGQEPVREALRTRAPARAATLRFPRDIRFDASSTDLIKHVLPRSVEALLYGPSGVGKTFLGIDLGYHLALGRTWHSKRVRSAVPVLYVPYEGLAAFGQRLLAANAEHGDPGAMFAYSTLAPPLCKGEAGDNGEKAMIAEATALANISGQPVGLIIIDTVSRAMSPDDDSSNQDAAALIVRWGRIRAATGAAILGVHHPGKDAARGMRGAYAFTGNTDVVLKAEDRGDVKVLVAEKEREAAGGDILAFRLKHVGLGLDEDGEEKTSLAIEPAELPRAEPRKKGRPPGTKDDIVAMQSLEKALEAHGKVPPASNHIPPGIVAVTLKEWQPYAVAKNLIDPDAEQKRKTERMKRLARRLDAISQAGTWQQYVWKIK